jgi:hypothetical protein
MHDHVEHIEDNRDLVERIRDKRIRDRVLDPIQHGESARLCVQEAPNPLADLLRGMPPGTFLTITVELKTPEKS